MNGGNETENESAGTDVSNLDGIGSTSRAGGSELSKGEIFDLLKNRRRRTVIRFLRENDGYAELNDLAEYIAAKENDIDVRQLSSDQRKRVYIGLYQCHLPKMDEAGVVDFEKDRGHIVLNESAERLRTYLDAAGTERPSDPSYGFPVAITCAAVVAAGVADLGGL